MSMRAGGRRVQLVTRVSMAKIQAKAPCGVVCKTVSEPGQSRSDSLMGLSLSSTLFLCPHSTHDFLRELAAAERDRFDRSCGRRHKTTYRAAPPVTTPVPPMTPYMIW